MQLFFKANAAKVLRRWMHFYFYFFIDLFIPAEKFSRGKSAPVREDPPEHVCISRQCNFRKWKCPESFYVSLWLEAVSLCLSLWTPVHMHIHIHTQRMSPRRPRQRYWLLSSTPYLSHQIWYGHIKTDCSGGRGRLKKVTEFHRMAEVMDRQERARKKEKKGVD